MSKLTLLRHGQASFNSADYDRLSPLGARQVEALARWWLARGETFDEVWTGTLKRQQQTEQGLAAAWQRAGRRWPAAERHAGLDEFPAERVVRQLTPELCLRDREVRRLYRRYRHGGEAAGDALMALVVRVCEYWTRDDYLTPVAMRWRTFLAQVEEVMAVLGERLGGGRRVLAVTSGGVISVAAKLVGHDGTPTVEATATAIADNWRIPNVSLTEFAAGADGALELAALAAVEHLDEPLLTLR